MEKFFGVWKTQWKMCKTPAFSQEKSTFPRIEGVEKWKMTVNFIQLPKIGRVEKQKNSKILLTENMQKTG